MKVYISEEHVLWIVGLSPKPIIGTSVGRWIPNIPWVFIGDILRNSLKEYLLGKNKPSVHVPTLYYKSVSRITFLVSQAKSDKLNLATMPIPSLSKILHTGD